MIGRGFHGVHHLRRHLFVKHAGGLPLRLLFLCMPFGIRNRLDDALRFLHSLVCDHRHGIRDLHDVHRIALAEQHRVARSLIPFVRRMQHAGRLAGQPQTGILPDAEFADELVALLIAHLVTGHDHAHVG